MLKVLPMHSFFHSEHYIIFTYFIYILTFLTYLDQFHRLHFLKGSKLHTLCFLIHTFIMFMNIHFCHTPSSCRTCNFHIGNVRCMSSLLTFKYVFCKKQQIISESYCVLGWNFLQLLCTNHSYRILTIKKYKKGITNLKQVVNEIQYRWWPFSNQPMNTIIMTNFFLFFTACHRRITKWSLKQMPSNGQNNKLRVWYVLCCSLVALIMPFTSPPYTLLNIRLITRLKPWKIINK